MKKSLKLQALSTPTLNPPPLITQDCPDCQGEGYTLAFAGLAEETQMRCTSCNGQGSKEVCSYCYSELSLVKGIEVCQCLLLAKAA